MPSVLWNFCDCNTGAREFLRFVLVTVAVCGPVCYPCNLCWSLCCLILQGSSGKCRFPQIQSPIILMSLGGLSIFQLNLLLKITQRLSVVCSQLFKKVLCSFWGYHISRSVLRAPKNETQATILPVVCSNIQISLFLFALYTTYWILLFYTFS